MQCNKVSQKMQPLGNKSMEGSSRSHLFFKIGVLKNFANFTGEHLCWSLFLTKFFTDFIKNTPTQVFSCEICKIFKNTSFYRTPPVAASVKRDSNTGVYLWNLRNFWGHFFWQNNSGSCFWMDTSLEKLPNNKNPHDFLSISCVFYRYFQFPYSFPRNDRREKALSFWLSLQFNSFFQNNTFDY